MTTKKYKHRVETIDGVIEWENEQPPLPLPPPSTNNNNNRTNNMWRIMKRQSEFLNRTGGLKPYFSL
jgi:hypothetical protein